MSDFPLGLKRAANLCVLRHKDQFLLLKRAKNPHKGSYTPVGGKMEPHERPLDAAIRETWEETGIRLEHMQYKGILTETSPVKYNWICYVYLADIPFMPPPPCNEGELEWISFSQVLDVPTPKTDWFIYKYLMEDRPFAFEAVYNDQLELLEMWDDIEGTKIFQAT